MSTAVHQARQDDGYEIASWSLTQDETGEAMNAGRIGGIKTVQINSANFGTATLNLQGSMDGETWFSLHALDFDTGDYASLGAVAANTLTAIVENPRFIRPVQSDAAATIVVIVGGNSRL